MNTATACGAIWESVQRPQEGISQGHASPDSLCFRHTNVRYGQRGRDHQIEKVLESFELHLNWDS